MIDVLLSLVHTGHFLPIADRRYALIVQMAALAITLYRILEIISIDLCDRSGHNRTHTV